jgi:capsular exopolysaccharide synthesis family protein
MMFYGNSILEEIRRLHSDEQTGILTLTGTEGERLDIFFREGMIEAASSSDTGSRRLGDYLVEGGHVAARELDAVLSEAKKQKIFFGEAVVRRNLADQTYVGAAARNQSMDLLERALTGGFSVSCFTPSLRSYFAPARISFQHMLLELARGSNTSIFASDRETLLVTTSETDLSLFPWRPEEIFVLRELKYPTTFGALLASTGFDEKLLRKIVGVLTMLGAVEAGREIEDWKTQAGVALRKREPAFEELIPVVADAVLGEKLKIARNESSFTSEQFRNLKVQLRESDSQTLMKVFTVSSPEAEDGKSFISLNLAFSFSRDHGRRVILIDCDFRGPTVGEYLGVPSAPGLLQYLESPSLGPYCFVRRVENLYFMTTGGVASNPIEILSMHKMKQLIDHLRNDFDTIILDAPPYSPIADARVVTGLSDALIMVVRHGKTSYAAADQAFKAVDRNKLVGVVFNDVKPTPFRKYANLGYYQNRKKELVYSSSDSNSRRSKTYLEP